MKILVVGASGFIGKNFILRSPKEWKIFGIYNQSKDFLEFLQTDKVTNVMPCKCDLRNINEVQRVFEKHGKEFDVCLYTAGNSDIGLSIEQPIFDLNSNVASLINLLSNIKVTKFIYMSSGAVYLGKSGLVSDSTFVVPRVPYGINKLCCEFYVKFFQRDTDHIKKYVNVRFFGAYGPMELSRKIYTNLIKAFYLNNQDEYTLRGNGKNHIDAMYVDDAIEGLFKIIKSDKANLTVDFCQGEPLTVNALVLRVAQILGKEKIKVRHQGSSSEYIKFYASPKKMKQIFGFRPSIPLEEGIMKFAKFLEGTRESGR